MPANRSTPARHLLAWLTAIAIAIAAFLYRFNALGGTLGGFDNDEFATLTRVDMLLSGLEPLRDFTDAELRAVWPSLTWEVAAATQRIWGRNLLVHAYLTLGALAVCAGSVFLLARMFSRRSLVAALAAVVVIVSMTNPYNYPKVVVLTATAALLWWVLSAPTSVRVSLLGVWTVVAILFRQDYGVYVAIASLAGLIACQPTPWRIPARRVAIYIGVGLVVSLPSLAWVQHYAGIQQHLSDIIQSVRYESVARRLRTWPAIDLEAPLSQTSVVAFNYYAFWAIPIGGAALLAVRPFRPRFELDSERGVGFAMCAMALAANYGFLRNNLPVRFGDAAVPVVLFAAWMAGTAPSFRSRPAQWLLPGTVGVVMVAITAAFVSMQEVPRLLGESGLSVSVAETTERFQVVSATLRSLPPTEWKEKPTRGHLAMARYLAECTDPGDYVLVGTYADDVVYYARRRFAAGQAYFSGHLRTDLAQRIALGRLSRQSVPVAITDYDGEFMSEFALVAQHVKEHYREVGIIAGTDEQPLMRVFVEKARQPRAIDPVLGFPCFT